LVCTFIVKKKKKDKREEGIWRRTWEGEPRDSQKGSNGFPEAEKGQESLSNCFPFSLEQKLIDSNG
jgi:hypothetical protein